MEANNMAAMREALETLLNLAYEVQDANSECGPKTSAPARFLIDVAKSALAAPPRNCDVGTAEEQSRRLAEFCKSHGLVGGIPRCEKCRFLGDDNCELMWAQMPYDESEAQP